MEIPGIGPVILVDTAGIDDIGELGAKRIERSIEIVKQIDIALLLISDNTIGMSEKKNHRLFLRLWRTLFMDTQQK